MDGETHNEGGLTRTAIARHLGITVRDVETRVARGEIQRFHTPKGKRYRLLNTPEGELTLTSPSPPTTNTPYTPPELRSPLVLELFEIAKEALTQRDAATDRLATQRDLARQERLELQRELKTLRHERDAALADAESRVRRWRKSSNQAELRGANLLAVTREVIAIASELAEGRPNRKRRRELVYRLSKLQHDAPSTPSLRARR